MEWLVEVVQADVTNVEDVQNYVRQTVDVFRKIDVIYNNVGINRPFEDLDKKKINHFQCGLRSFGRGSYVISRTIITFTYQGIS